MAMHALSGIVKQLLWDEGGVTSIEYALLGSLIAVAIVGAVTSLGTTLGNLYQNVATKLGAAI
jgi:pilus assembly protein Flp/PilA